MYPGRGRRADVWWSGLRAGSEGLSHAVENWARSVSAGLTADPMFEYDVGFDLRSQLLRCTLLHRRALLLCVCGSYAIELVDDRLAKFV
jgi:hypothetical protein